ncbi:pyridoxamine 5'-phosphate oxidase [Arcicella rigui]|uniref:Pyridoxine/pyridoxamine 5'-phosphate oxidase n=1 Tax=Arcicella rigui TaxID=797020 RepID=A0ABU5Q9K7_9BACT|nr:pyridoxamine 5'-phosphate oxidase [Arcicella rigui]MEA5139504.1 pyridoxamine 5'-phosphate oxidase [Arcicella rigui]
MTHINIAALRENYTKGSLDVEDVNASPLEQFKKWFHEAIESKLPEPNAMLVSTVSADGKPSARVVLLKGIDEGFTFYTNYLSRKGAELAENPHACITFFWVELERQVRIEGKMEKVSAEESDAYFQVRPLGSQIGAWVSNQSMVIESREVLEEREKHLKEKFGNEPIPRPPHWGGYRLIPEYVEFWQGRPSRLHDRIAYTKLEEHTWKIERLSP